MRYSRDWSRFSRGNLPCPRQQLVLSANVSPSLFLVQTALRKSDTARLRACEGHQQLTTFPTSIDSGQIGLLLPPLGDDTCLRLVRRNLLSSAERCARCEGQTAIHQKDRRLVGWWCPTCFSDSERLDRLLSGWSAANRSVSRVRVPFEN